MYGDSEILNENMYFDLVSQLKKEKSEIRKVRCLLSLNKQNLKEGSLQNFQTKLWEDFSCSYNATLVIIRSNFNKKFAFFFPNKLEKIDSWKKTNKHFYFYWIDDD